MEQDTPLGGTPMLPAFLTEAEVAQHLKLRPSTLQQWRFAKTGPPYYQFGRAIRYLLTDVEAWLAAQRVDSLAPASTHSMLLPRAKKR